MRTAFLLSFVGVGAANLVAKNIINFNDYSSETLRTLRGRQASNTCPVGYAECDTGCIESLGACCGLGDGTYCPSSYTCVDNGCCPVGETCEGEAEVCSEENYEICNNYCIPSGKTCCSNGTWCEANQTCSDNGCLTADGQDAQVDPSASFPGQLGATPTNRRPAQTNEVADNSIDNNNDQETEEDSGSIARANIALVAAGALAAMLI